MCLHVCHFIITDLSSTSIRTVATTRYHNKHQYYNESSAEQHLRGADHSLADVLHATALWSTTGTVVILLPEGARWILVCYYIVRTSWPLLSKLQETESYTEHCTYKKTRSAGYRQQKTTYLGA